MVVAVARSHAGERLAPVGRLEHAGVVDIHRVLIDRIGKEVNVVIRALQDIAFRVDAAPRIAAILGDVQASLVAVGLDERVDLLGIRAGNRDADLAHADRRESAGEARPIVAAVGRSEQSVVLAARVDRPGLAADRPHRREEDIGVLRIHCQVVGAGVLADLEHLLPRPSAVFRAVHAPLRIRPEDVAKGGHVREIRVGGMDADSGDEAGLLESDVLPGLAGVGGLIHTVAVRDVAARAGGARPHVDDVRVGVGDGHRADRADVDLPVRHGRFQVTPASVVLNTPPALPM